VTAPPLPPTAEQQVEVELSTRRPKQKCRSCGAQVTFWRTKIGKWMPFDGDPTPEIQAALFEEPTTGFLPARANHFMTCPDADKWRRR
jgi:hypothetical protein